MHMLEAGMNLIYIYAKTNPNSKRKFISENASSCDVGKRYNKQDKEDLIGWLF